MPFLTFRFNEFAPDQGDYFADEGGRVSVTECEGVIPNSTGFRTVTRFAPVDADAFKTFGAAAVTTGTLFSYVGLTGAAVPINEWLYGYDGGSAAGQAIVKRDQSAVYSNIGRAGGYTASGGFGWKFCRFGNSIIATNRSDAIQRSTVTTTAGTFAKNNVIATPTTGDPRCRFVESFKGYLFLGWIDLTAGTSGGETYGGAYGPLTAGIHSDMVWWSDLDDPTRFTTPLTTPSVLNSDFKKFTDNFGEIKGLKATYDYLVIARENAIMACVGPPFTFYPITTTIGCRYHNSMVATGTDVYLWTRRGPAVIKNGQEIQFIGDERISRYFEEFVSSTADLERYIYGAVTIDGKYIVWTLPSEYAYLGGGHTRISDLLIYSIDSDSFGVLKEYGFGSATPMCSYNISRGQLGTASSSQALDGISVLATSLRPGDVSVGTETVRLATPDFVNEGGLYYQTAADGSINLATPSYTKIRTSFFTVPKDETRRTMMIRKIRPIQFNGSARSLTPPAPSSNEFLRKIRLFPRNRYCRLDRSLNTTDSFAPDPNSYIEFDYNSWIQEKATGYILIAEVPFAEMWSVEFIFSDSIHIKNIYGFDMEVAYGNSTPNYDIYGW